jgi:hydroxyacylglutathione hydrolase
MKLPARYYCLMLALAITVLWLGLRVPAATQNPPVGTPPPSVKPLPVTTNNATTEKAGPITRPQIVSIAYNTYFINEFGLDSQYLLIGTNRALLIDTGTGFYDIKGTVEKLTNLPYDVVITHGHHDHAGMIGNFDTVYMHPAESTSGRSNNDNEKSQKDPPREPRPYNPSSAVSSACTYIWGIPAEAKWRRSDKHPTIKPLSDGQTFDLGGGRVVTVYHIPGHTLGSCVLLDRKTRILISGDVANSTVDIRGKSEVAVSTRLRGWIKLQNMRSEYDRIFHGHSATGCDVDLKPLDPEILGDLIEVYRQVLRGEAKLAKIENPDRPGQFSTKAVWKKVQVDFDPNYLWEPGEPHIIP